MNKKKRVLLLIGSAKHPHSTSESMGTYLIEKLREQGFETETLFLHKSIKSDNRREALLEATRYADIIVMAFPLYVDCLPYLVIRTMELMAGNRQEKGNLMEQSLLCIVNSGFPEAFQNDTAISICRKFACETDFTWAGGLALGGGEAVNGKPLLDVKGMARNIIKSLNLTADALAAGESVSQEAVKLMAKPLIPSWMYLLLGGMGWKKRAKNHGVHKKLFNRPYFD